jgi:hypothetical protein
MKHFREIAVILALVVAGIAFSEQAQEGSKKPLTEGAKKSECCAKMKTKSGEKMSCCSSDSACAKDAKSGAAKH